jgi:hypothetical protein
MFLFFETSIDFNILPSAKSWLFKHLIGDEYGLRICPFGQIAIFGLIFIILGRHYFTIPKKFIKYALILSFILSLINLNAVVYLIPIWIIEILLHYQSRAV